MHFEGTVFDEKNAVIKQAQVQIVQGALIINSIKSDENGKYNIYLPLNAEYDIIVLKKGYAQKKYLVSTKNIPPEKSQIQFATNVADLVLFTKYNKVDYSLFDKPMNKYYYNPDKDNIIYDEDYLNEMKLAMKAFKNAQHEALILAEEKAIGDKRIAENIAYEKAKSDKMIEKSKAAEKLALEKINNEKQLAEKSKTEEIPFIKEIKPDKPEKETLVTLKIEELNTKPQKIDTATTTVIEQKDKTIVALSTLIKKDIKSLRTIELLSKYKPGITEEIFEGMGVYIIQRVLVKKDMVWVYQKKIFNWGGVACFRDKESITESIFDSETRKS